MKKRRRQRGQGLIEYLILVALMAVGTIAVVRSVGYAVQARFVDAMYAIQGNGKRSKSESFDESSLKKKDMSDFMNGAADRK